MSMHREKSIVLLLTSLVGLLISVLSGFWEQIPFFKSLCSAACQDTSEVRFLSLPFWVWGAAFYALIALLAVVRKESAPWIIAPAAGVEVSLVWLMIEMKAPCIFCIANGVVVALLLIISFRKRLAWQEATLALLFFALFSLWIPHENVANSASTGSEPGIAAIVGDETITDERLDVLLGTKLLELRKEIYRMKREKLDQLIVEIILQKEAKEQGKTTDQFLDETAPLSRFTASDEEVDKYLRDNEEKLAEFQGTVQELRKRVKSFLEQQKRSQALKDLAHSFYAKYGVRINLPVPYPPRVKIDLEGAPAQGPPEAPVMIVEFSDYECPACRSTHEVVKKVKAAYGSSVQWVYKDYPLRRHKYAFKAAEAAHCADDQGNFWEYQDLLFNADDLAVENLVKIAGELGMSKDKFSRCLNDSKYKEMVEKNVQDAARVGVDRTPSFIINGSVYVGGHAFEKFKQVIDDELAKSASRK
ncbi:MAG: thioredoxin domain-containing protein [Syntrophobacteraceae bacterium]